VSQKYRLSLKVRHLEVLWSTENCLKNSISTTSSVTPEMLGRLHGNIVKRPNACLDANGQILNIYFNKIIFVEVFDCCVTSQAHQNGCLGIQ
jgi:hypothetical protein